MKYYIYKDNKRTYITKEEANELNKKQTEAFLNGNWQDLQVKFIYKEEEIDENIFKISIDK